jgi:hypothetical protein
MMLGLSAAWLARSPMCVAKTREIRCLSMSNILEPGLYG